MSIQLFIEDLIHQAGIAVAECEEEKFILKAENLIDDLKILKENLKVATHKLNRLKLDISVSKKK